MTANMYMMKYFISFYSPIKKGFKEYFLDNV